jgi:drug/metabolite transporter (DMT)-like permease
LCALNGALVPAVAKLTTGQADPLLVATTTTVFAGAFAATVLTLRGDLHVLFRAPARLRLALVGALGTGVAFVLFYAGAQQTSAIETALCLQIEPAYSLIIAWLFLGHRPDLRRIGATLTLMLGITLAVGARGLTGSTGVWMLLATPICWQVSHLIVLRTLRGISAVVLTGARYVFGGALLVAAWLMTLPAADPLTLTDFGRLLPLLAFQGIVLSYGGTWLWYQSILRLDLARATAIVVPSIPMLSLVASFFLLGEVPTPAQWAGLVLVAAGVLTFVTAPDVATSLVRADPREGRSPC